MQISKRFVRSLLTSPAWLLGVAVSLALYLLVNRMIEEKNAAQFNAQAENAQLAVQNRMRSYIDVLRGASALFQTSDHISLDAFQAYVESLNLATGFPGINNLNFALQVPASRKQAFIDEMRANASRENYRSFALKSHGERDSYHVLAYIEPLKGNEKSLGLDLASIPAVAKALAASRDSGQLTSSGRLIEINGPQREVGMAMRIPLYRRGLPLNTVEQRRAAYYGSVGAGLNLTVLMQGAVDENTLRYMRIRLYDAGTSDAPSTQGDDKERMLFDVGGDEADRDTPATAGSPGEFFIRRVSMTVGPRVWEAEFTARKKAMASGLDSSLAWLVLVAGLASSTLLFGVYYSLTTARRRAVELARDMTKDLRASEASLAEAQHMARLGSWTLEPASGRMTWSAETFRILGQPRRNEALLYDDYLKHVGASDRARVRDGLDRAIASGDEFTTEHRIERTDGSERWVQTICRIGYDDRNQLLRGILMDITDRKQTVEALKRSQELLRDLTAHQDRVKEDERKRIAREIHDELGQTLLALRIDVSMLDARTGTSHPKLNAKVRGALGHIDATVKTIRTIINNLRPAVLDLGLTAAIEWQVAEFRRRSGITCDLFLDSRELEVDDTRATSLFRILQESLTNVIRHANASHVVIQLYEEKNRLVMKITDNGVGIYPEDRESPNSFGLVGVEERINALEGEFMITSAPGKGTTLTIFIPLAPRSEGPEAFKVIDSVE